MHSMFTELSNAHIRRQLGDRIRSHRKNRRMTQQALADRAGLSRPTLSNLERGHDVSLDSLLSVLRALDLLDAFDAALAPPPASPMATLQRTSRPAQPTAQGWAWGDAS